MMDFKFLFYLLILGTHSNCQSDFKVFSEMKDIVEMRSLKDGQSNPFKVKIISRLNDNSCRIKMTSIGEFILGVDKNNVVFSKIFDKQKVVLFDLKNKITYSDHPFGGYKFIRDSIILDKKNDSIFYFSLIEMKFDDVIFPRSDSIKFNRIVFSKKKGFIELLIEERKSNNLFIAKHY